jgi:hypothetical protein
LGVTNAAPWSDSSNGFATICVVVKSCRLITAMRALALSPMNRNSPS